MRLSQRLLLLIIVVWVSGCAPDRRQAAEIFGNMTYYVGNEHSSESVTLVDSLYRSAFLNVFYENKFVYGDFNHDGLKDAAVILEKNSGGSAYVLSLNFLINDGKKLVHKAFRKLEDGSDVNKISQRNGKVLIDMYIRQKNDWARYPLKRVKNVYKYTGADIFDLRNVSISDEKDLAR
jgi:hypothetical protein